jgi:hypothetical protein
VIERRAPTTSVPAVPPHFVRHFVVGGWREVERVYGCRTQLMMTWNEMSGGLAALQDQRRQHLRDCVERARQMVHGETGPKYGVALAAVSRGSARG